MTTHWLLVTNRWITMTFPLNSTEGHVRNSWLAKWLHLEHKKLKFPHRKAIMEQLLSLIIPQLINFLEIPPPSMSPFQIILMISVTCLCICGQIQELESKRENHMNDLSFQILVSTRWVFVTHPLNSFDPPLNFLNSIVNSRDHHMSFYNIPIKSRDLHYIVVTIISSDHLLNTRNTQFKLSW